jgi:hypothetical protein
MDGDGGPRVPSGSPEFLRRPDPIDTGTEAIDRWNIADGPQQPSDPRTIRAMCLSTPVGDRVV